MNLLITSRNDLFFYIKKYWFENVIFILLLLYTLFYFTPSSYAEALKLLGIPNEGLIFSTSKPIRSDEWSVWTPYLQALVNNHFQRFNAYSIYHEDFRNFNALPIYDWALFFKPQFWSFLIAEPARAFSFHHGFLIAAFIVGWKLLIQKILAPYQYASPGIAVSFSLLLFFSGFIQTVWTTMGPIIAIFPWLMLALLSWKRHSISYYALLTYITTVWLLSHTYPPLIISSAYLGLIILGAFQTNFLGNTKRCIFSLLACAIGLLITVYYYRDVIVIMMNTVYPGKRMSVGGEGNIYNWLSTLIPYITHGYNNRAVVVDDIAICEATAVSSLLPLLSLCFANVRTIKQLFCKEIILLSSLAIFFSIWWLLPVPQLIGSLFLLTKVAAHRLFFALGLTFNLIALLVLVRQGAELTLKRLVIFSLLLGLCWCIPDIFEYFKYFKKAATFEKSTIEMLLIPILGTLWIINHYKKINSTVLVQILVSGAMLLNIMYFASFNPIQSAQPIFTAKNSEAVAFLKKIAQQDSRGWLVIPGVRSAVLNGLGLKSFTHTLIQPQLHFFRTLFPNMPENEFNNLFNRYANVYLHNIPEPDSPWPDLIRIPLKKVAQQKSAAVISSTACTINVENAGNLDFLMLKNKTLYFDGWAMGNEHHYLTNLKNSKLVSYIETPRLDIAAEKKDKDLVLSGFNFEIKLSDEDINLIRQEGFCLFSESHKYGIKTLFHFSANNVEAFIKNMH
ncbi:MAG: hypothetical protein ABL903_12000 [Methylococcales bacterium]